MPCKRKELAILTRQGLLRYALFENNLWALQFNFSRARIEQILNDKKEREKQNREISLNHRLAEWSVSDWENTLGKIWVIPLSYLILSFLSIWKITKR